MTQVWVSESGPWLSYHNLSQIASTWDMQAVDEETAQAEGAVPCSECFDEAGPIYNYDYMGGADG